MPRQISVRSFPRSRTGMRSVRKWRGPYVEPEFDTLEWVQAGDTEMIDVLMASFFDMEVGDTYEIVGESANVQLHKTSSTSMDIYLNNEYSETWDNMPATREEYALRGYSVPEVF